MADLSLLESYGANWVWPKILGDSCNTYVDFRQEFTLKKAIKDAELIICSESDYAVWINGAFLNCGQYLDYTDHKTCDLVNTKSLLKAGKNVICVLAYYQGEDSSRYIKDDPGLIYLLKAADEVIVSDQDTFFRQSATYKIGRMPKVTGQIGFTFEYDARNDDNWTEYDYILNPSWGKAEKADLASVSDRPVKKFRPIEKLHIGDKIKSNLIAQGVFIRKNNGTDVVAELVQSDFISPSNDIASADTQNQLTLNVSAASGADGIYLIFDLGEETAGLLSIDIEAASGTILDIAYGEHLEDMRVRANVGGRNFANRYICKDGPQKFTHYFLRLAGRYLEVHITPVKDTIKLNHLSICPTVYPVDIKGSFDCSDTLDNKIYETSLRTLSLCMHEHYEDCPWREQSLYAMDARNQALAGYYCFGDYKFAAASLALQGRGMHDDGFLELCSPAKIEITIPSFTFAWVLAVADNYLYSGDISIVKNEYKIIENIIDACSRSITDGLLPCPQGKRYWHFYDWTDGLDGCCEDDCNSFSVVTTNRYDAILNLFYCMVLDAASKLASALGYGNKSNELLQAGKKIKEAANRNFWNEKEGIYKTYLLNGSLSHSSEFVQAIAILAGVCSNERADLLRNKLSLKDNGLVKTSISHSLYKFEALLTDKDKYGKIVFQMINETWGKMLYCGATSFWETQNGASDFANAGSLCHGWSGIPPYFYGSYILGIRPIEPGFKKYSFSPINGVFYKAKGIVPTPSGPINILIEQKGNSIDYSLKAPECLEKVD